ncbi:MAG TPA: DUF2846 domain-containing protein [Stellaceae bacterium]|nr:DUF2846 domain-containing protein [Stellaceae bacterium]
MAIPKTAARPVIAGILLLLLAACASGPQFSQMQSSLPALSADNCRIFVYRSTVLGAAIQPSVKINGDVVGSAVPRGFFYVDRPPGDYEITTITEVTRTLSLHLDAGQTRYVRLGISMGFFVGHVYPELVDDAAGSAEIQELHYIGK